MTVLLLSFLSWDINNYYNNKELFGSRCTKNTKNETEGQIHFLEKHNGKRLYINQIVKGKKHASPPIADS